MARRPVIPGLPTSVPHRLHPSVLAVVALGGAAGAVLRHLLTAAFPVAPHGFPWPTFAINVVGCFVLALLPAVEAVRAHPHLPPLLGTGLLGGFTTLSAWSEESRALAEAGRVGLAGGYALGTFAACLAAVTLADRLSTRAQRAQFEAEEGDL